MRPMLLIAAILALAAAPPTTINAEAANLYANVERLTLDATQILPLHGRQVTMSACGPPSADRRTDESRT